MDMEKRIRMAAESILENEALREGLDDEAASALLDWGIARAKQITVETADIEDDDEADEAAYPRMRALRQILRAAVDLCAENVEPAQKTALHQEIAEQVPLVYGQTASFEAANVSISKSGNPAQTINDLRASIENSTNAPATQNTETKEVPKEQEVKKRNFFFDWLSKL